MVHDVTTIKTWKSNVVFCFETSRDWRYNRSLEIERLLNVRNVSFPCYFHVLSRNCVRLRFLLSLSLCFFPSFSFFFFFGLLFDRWLTWNLLEVTDGRLLAHKLRIFLFRKFEAFIFKSAIIQGKEFLWWIRSVWWNNL